MKIKICGQTRAEDISYSFDQGADYCGVVIEVASSKRSLTVEKAIPLFKEFNGRLVALTADADMELYTRIIDKLNPFALQLTAYETAGDVANLKKRFDVKLFKSIHLPQPDSGETNPEKFLAMIENYQKSGADAFVLDTLVADMYGGSGKKSDWSLAGKVLMESSADIFIAGGIDPENIAEAVALNPYGVDLASGVEVSPGIKSREKIDNLFATFKASR